MDAMPFKMLAVAFLLAAPAVGAETLLPQLRVEPKTAGSIFFVRNVSSQPLTAYVIELVNYPGSYYALWQDEIMSEAIPPGQEKRIEVANMTVGAVPDYVKIQGAIYADGSTAGVPDKVSQLVDRRRFCLTTVRDMIRQLEAGRAASTPNETVAANLRHAAEVMQAPPTAGKTAAIRVNQAAGKSLLAETAGYVEKHSLDETLAKLHGWAKAMAESKPAL